MSHFIVSHKEKGWLYPRRNNGKLYENRSCWGPDAKQARVFNTSSAARNSANAAGGEEAKVVPCTLMVKTEDLM